MWTFLLLVATCALAIKWYNRLVLSPPKLLIIGNIGSFFRSSAALQKRNIILAPSLYRIISSWFPLFVAVIKPHQVEALLTNKVNLRKSYMYQYLMLWIGRGLVASDGEKWKKNRKLLTPAFHFKTLESFVEIFNANSKILCEKFDREVEKSGFDVMNYCRLLALDNICETSMGIAVNSQLNPDSELINATTKICHISYVRVIRPWLWVNRWFNLTRLGREQKKALEVLHHFTGNVINNRIQQRRTIPEGKEEEEDCDNKDVIGIKAKQAFIDILLDAMDQGQMTLQEVHDEVNTFIFTGHDSITSALAFCIYNLAHHPEYQALAYEEICEIFGDDDRTCTTDDVPKMKYLEMVIKETLRIHATVPIFDRYIEKDLALDKDTVLPKGCEGVVIPVRLHTDPESWERPNEFYPDHFLPEAVAKRHPFAFVPFSAGPRNCIGQRFAMLAMKITISNILRRFQLLPKNPIVPLKLKSEVVLHSKTGVNISIVRRSRN